MRRFLTPTVWGTFLMIIIFALLVTLASCTSTTRVRAQDPNVYDEHGLTVHKMSSGDICYVVKGGTYGLDVAISCVKH